MYIVHVRTGRTVSSVPVHFLIYNNFMDINFPMTFAVLAIHVLLCVCIVCVFELIPA